MRSCSVSAWLNVDGTALIQFGWSNKVCLKVMSSKMERCEDIEQWNSQCETAFSKWDLSLLWPYCPFFPVALSLSFVEAVRTTFFKIHFLDQYFIMSWKSCVQNIFFSKCIYNCVSVTFLTFLTVHTGNLSSYNSLIRNLFPSHDCGQVTDLMRATWCH